MACIESQEVLSPQLGTVHVTAKFAVFVASFTDCILYAVLLGRIACITYRDAAYLLLPMFRSQLCVCVCVCVCLSVTTASSAKTAEPIKMPFGGVDLGGPKEP